MLVTGVSVSKKAHNPSRLLVSAESACKKPAHSSKARDEVIYPRRKVGEDARMADKVVVTPKVLEEHFDMPLQTAAIRLGVCATAIKKACRRFGIARWPFRERLRRATSDNAAGQAAAKSRFQSGASASGESRGGEQGWSASGIASRDLATCEAEGKAYLDVLTATQPHRSAPAQADEAPPSASSPRHADVDAGAAGTQQQPQQHVSATAVAADEGKGAQQEHAEQGHCPSGPSAVKVEALVRMEVDA